MTRSAVLVPVLAFALALTLVACGDDDGGGTTDSGPRSDTATPPTPPGPTPPPTPPGPPPPPTPPGPPPPPASGMCTNESDMARLAMRYGPMMDQEVSDVAGSCALECFADGTEACVTNCMVRETMMSMGCASCFTASVGCVRDNCIGPCLADRSSPACLACQCGDNDAMMNCREVFTACSGVTSDDCG